MNLAVAPAADQRAALLPRRLASRLREILCCLVLAANSLALAQQENPYAKTFDDFAWSEEESRDTPGSVPLGSSLPTAAAIRQFEQRVAENADDPISLVILGQLYYRHAKEADDWMSYNRAADALERALKIQPQYDSAAVHLAHVYAARHQFLEALHLASEVHRRDPRAPRALAIIADCQLELGQYDEAKASLDRLAALEQSPPVLARLARYAELHGDTDKALARLDEALTLLDALGAPPEEIHWYRWRKAGLLVGQGEFAEAEPLYRHILEEDPAQTEALVGLAEVQHARGDTDAAIATLQTAVALQPAPPVMAQLGDLYASRGEKKTAELWYQKTEAAMREELTFAGDAHAREVAMFFADHDRHADEALVLAVEDMRRRQDIYAYDTLAWCQYKNGQFAAARENMRSALKLGTRDATLFYHAATISEAVGEESESAEWWKKLAQLNAPISAP